MPSIVRNGRSDTSPYIVTRIPTKIHVFGQARKPGPRNHCRSRTFRSSEIIEIELTELERQMANDHRKGPLAGGSPVPLVAKETVGGCAYSVSLFVKAISSSQSHRSTSSAAIAHQHGASPFHCVLTSPWTPGESTATRG